MPTPTELQRHLPDLEVLDLIGQGGMGLVYRARQIRLDRTVALKVLPQPPGRDQSLAERFAREAQALARLSHPNIVAVYDFGKTENFFFLIMEYVDGVDLREVEQTRRLSPKEILTVIPKICDALQYAHDEGIVHRDIKPSNILIDRRGRVKIADFGLAKILGRAVAGPALTGTGLAMGTPQYMAPEQMREPKLVDHRADLYSLGVVFYEMLTGELPIGRFEMPSERVRVDARLDEVVLRALEREPSRRYQHASEIKKDIEAVSQSPPPVGAEPDTVIEPNRVRAADIDDTGRPGVSGYAVGHPLKAPSLPQSDCLDKLRLPAIGLVVSGILNLACGLFSLVWLAFNSTVSFEGGVFSAVYVGSQPVGRTAFAGFVCAAALVTSSSVLLLFGGRRMLTLRSYNWAVVTCILGVLALGAGWPFGLAFGIRGLCILNRPAIQAAFRNARKAAG